MLLYLLLFNFTIKRIGSFGAKVGEGSLMVNICQFLLKWDLIRTNFARCQHCLDNVSKCKHIRRGIIHRNHSSWIKRFTKKENWTGRDTWSYYFLFKCAAALIGLANSCGSLPKHRSVLQTSVLLESTGFSLMHVMPFGATHYFSPWCKWWKYIDLKEDASGLHQKRWAK